MQGQFSLPFSSPMFAGGSAIRRLVPGDLGEPFRPSAVPIHRRFRGQGHSDPAHRRGEGMPAFILITAPVFAAASPFYRKPKAIRIGPWSGARSKILLLF